MFIAPQMYIINSSVDTFCVGNHMGLSAIWKKLHGNRRVIARDEAECNLGLV